MCRLGRHVPYTKEHREGIFRVGKAEATRMANKETERWFDLIGDFPTASLLKLYSQVSRRISDLRFRRLCEGRQERTSMSSLFLFLFLLLP